jgi:hypothetical protein
MMMSVDDDSSYNPDRIAALCRKRPLKLTFCPPLESTQKDVLPDTSESTINDFKESWWNNGPTAWKPIHNRLGRLYSPDIQRIADAQKATSSQSEIVRADESMAESMTADPVLNGIYLTSLGVSLSDWLRGIGCLTCLALFNHYKIFTVSQFFDRGITNGSLSKIRSGPFGHLITPVQTEWIATAAYGVYYVYDVLSSMVDKVVNHSILHPEEYRTLPTLPVDLSLETALPVPQIGPQLPTTPPMMDERIEEEM